MTYFCRGIRGATTAEVNTREAILEATHDMLERLIAENGLRQEDIASAIFSMHLAQSPSGASEKILAPHFRQILITLIMVGVSRVLSLCTP